MRRLIPWLAFVAGIVIVAALMPRFNAAQPKDIRLTRADAVPLADRAARDLGIPVDKAWATLSWTNSPLLDRELGPKPELRRRAEDDPVIGPRLGGYHRVYYRRGLEKSQPYGDVTVDHKTAQISEARLKLRNEEAGAKLTEGQLRPRADEFVRTHKLPGAPNPVFESARPSLLRQRTDWIFRYRVKSDLPTGNVVHYLYVYFAGDRFAGWALIEEYADGSAFRGDSGGGIAAAFARFLTNYAMLLVLVVIFLKKYHAGEVGIGTGSVLLLVAVLLSGLCDIVMGPSAGEGSTMGSLDAQRTAAAEMGFKFLLYDLPLGVLVFFAWSVGESIARERWGERLASFDALLRRDPLNATVGRSLVNGVLFSPAVAAAAFLSGLIPLVLRLAHPALGSGTEVEVVLGGPILVLLFAALDAVIYPVLALFVLASTHRRRRFFPLGIMAIVILGMVGAVCDVPTEPFGVRFLFDFGGIAAVVAIFLGYDLLTTAIALFGGTLISMTTPLLSVAQGHMLMQVAAVTIAPLAAFVVIGVGALMTKREVVYRYEDLAPHVKRIVERERVKAEIDAANRIQAALLPQVSPELIGATVASHYRAATEIGGDYFDFLPRPNGEVGIAFGDVAGHGLTSGIVMAMAKAALLVQVDVDPSPRTVMNVLNGIVMKTAPKRMMMTFFFGLLDPRTHQLRFSSAGHLDPYVFRAETQRLEALSSWGFPLGVRRREPFRELIVDFLPGDRLILYSDGLIEAVDDDGEPFGFERFERTILDAGHLSADDIKKTLLSAIRKFTRNRPPEDDQTLVVVGFEEAAESKAIA
jgi:serine phosphatase RsbU (regulator of sigma subunit)